MIRVSLIFLLSFVFSTLFASAQVSAQQDKAQDASSIQSDAVSKAIFDIVVGKQQENQAEKQDEPVLPKNDSMQFSFIANNDCAGCVWIAAEGSISSDTPDIFVDFLNKNSVPSQSLIFLHSNGGDLLAAMTLGKIFREKGFNTNIARIVKNDKEGAAGFVREAGYCANACVWSYLGGQARSLDEGSVIALKAYRPPLDEAGTLSGMEVPSRKQQLVEVAYIDDYASLMGFDRDIIFIDWQNPEPHRFTPDEVASYNMSYAPNDFESWYLIPEKGGLIAQTNTKNNQRAVQFYCENRTQKIIEIIVPVKINEAELDNLKKNPISIRVFGKKVKLDKSQFSYNENNTLLKVKLNQFTPSTLLEDNYNIVIDNNAGAPQYSGQLTLFEIKNFNDLASFKQMSQLALHSCIDDK